MGSGSVPMLPSPLRFCVTGLPLGDMTYRGPWPTGGARELAGE